VTGTQANVEAQSTPTSWATYNNNAGQSFGSFGGKEGNINIPSGNQGTVLDLYQNTANSTGVYEGKFTINSTGLITYTSATAVPEPSALAALAGGAGLLGLIRRRRAVAA
jgi:hypothetical protein